MGDDWEKLRDKKLHVRIKIHKKSQLLNTKSFLANPSQYNKFSSMQNISFVLKLKLNEKNV